MPPTPASAAGLLTALDAGDGLASAARALVLLQLADPGGDHAAHATLSIAGRDLHLLSLRSATFGNTLATAHDCTECGTTMEIAAAAEGLQSVLREAADELDVVASGTTVRVRQANSADLLAALAAPSLDEQRAILTRRCIYVPAGADSQDALARPEVQAALDQLHEAAELHLQAACPACGAVQDVLLDVASFLWAELRRAGAFLLDDVHELALAYGWAEDAILAMPARRRTAYLERLRQ